MLQQAVRRPQNHITPLPTGAKGVALVAAGVMLKQVTFPDCLFQTFSKCFLQWMRTSSGVISPTESTRRSSAMSSSSTISATEPKWPGLQIQRRRSHSVPLIDEDSDSDSENGTNMKSDEALSRVRSATDPVWPVL